MRVGDGFNRRALPLEFHSFIHVCAFRVSASQNQFFVSPAVQPLFPVEGAKPVFFGLCSGLDLVEILSVYSYG